MSGLEIAVGIAGIISALVAVGNVIRDARHRREEKKTALELTARPAETRLIQTVDNAPSRIKAEYNTGYARFGETFARGDCILSPIPTAKLRADIANTDLVSVLVNMNSSLVNVINSLVTAGRVTFSASQLNAWNTTGARSMGDTVTILSQLYQRRIYTSMTPPRMIQETLDEVNWLLPNGGYYRGQARNGLKHGRGEEFTPFGEYIGDYKYNMRDGVGKARWPDGSSYEGDWVKDSFHGYGIWTGRVPGEIYQGQWNNGKHHGYGMRIWEDGSKYEGFWVNSVGHGYGVYVSAREKYEGEFINGKRHGHGLRTWQEGHKYEGNWKAENMCGEGTLILRNGTEIRGMFSNGFIIYKSIVFSDGERMSYTSLRDVLQYFPEIGVSVK